MLSATQDSARKPNNVIVVGSSGIDASVARALRVERLARRLATVTAERGDDTQLSAKAVIFDPLGRVLVLKSANDKWHDLPGGHVQEGEDPTTGLAREVREETGLSIGDIQVRELLTLKLGRKTRPVQFFRATVNNTDVRLSAEHLNSEWVRPENLANFNLGVLLAPAQRIATPSIRASETVKSADLSPITLDTETHHETARRAAEKLWQAALDNWLADLNADLVKAFFGHKELDYDGVWLPVFDQALAAWPETVQRVAAKAYATTARTLAHDANVDLEPDEKALKAFANSRGSALERFPVAVRDKVAASVKRGLAGGEDRRALARRVDEALREVQGGAARRVAATEAQVVYGQSQNEVLAAAGFKRKRWVTVGDDRVRDSHYLCEGQGWIPVSEPFHNGLHFPGDPNGDISEVANCRCNLEGQA